MLEGPKPPGLHLQRKGNLPPGGPHSITVGGVSPGGTQYTPSLEARPWAAPLLLVHASLPHHGEVGWGVSGRCQALRQARDSELRGHRSLVTCWLHHCVLSSPLAAFSHRDEPSDVLSVVREASAETGEQGLASGLLDSSGVLGASWSEEGASLLLVPAGRWGRPLGPSVLAAGVSQPG